MKNNEPRLPLDEVKAFQHGAAVRGLCSQTYRRGGASIMEIHSVCKVCGREFTYNINQRRACKRQICEDCKRQQQRERYHGTLKQQGLTVAEKRELNNQVTNAISKWATETFGEENAFKTMNYVRGLARNAVAPNGYDRRGAGMLYQSREEAKVVMEAAEDIMAVVDSIRRKAIHGKEV